MDGHCDSLSSINEVSNQVLLIFQPISVRKTRFQVWSLCPERSCVVARAASALLTPVEAYRDKIRKRTGIEVIFTRSIIEYRIHGKTCVLSNKFV
jgi:hypothetical protein